MYNNDMLRGILLGVARHNLTIYTNENAKLGYSINFSLNIRGDKLFLMAVKRSLLQLGVKSKLKSEESSRRKRPLLKITGIVNLKIISDLLPIVPNYRNDLNEFKQIVDIINKNKHKTLNGLEMLMKIKGVL